MPYKRTNLRSVKLLSTPAASRIAFPNSSTRLRLNFGQDGDTELPFSISAWIFAAETAQPGILFSIVDRTIGSPTFAQNQFIVQRDGNARMNFLIIDSEGDKVKIDHDGNPATP